MTVGELDKILNGKESVISDGTVAVKSFYAGDFLSNVISRAGDAAAWFTVMNNVNVAGVAVLTEAAAIVLCEGFKPDAALLKRVQEQKLNLILTDLPVYEACISAGGKKK